MFACCEGLRSKNYKNAREVEEHEILGDKEQSLGLTYVALSRVTSLGGLILRGNHSMDRIMKINLHKKHQEREDAEAFLDTLPSE